jgi:type IV secretion system protein VirB10
MSQNTSDPRDTSGDDPEVTHNPYFRSQHGDAEQDLDARAPQLSNEESQRLNRRALLFLGGIVLLLIAAGSLLFLRGRSADDKKPTAERVERPFIPDVPESPPVVDAAPPPVSPVPLMPPLPPEEVPQPRQPVANYGPTQPSGPTLMQRRMADGGVFGAGGDRQAGSGLSDPMAQAIAERDARVQQNLASMGAGNVGSGAERGGEAQVELAPIAQANFLRKRDTLLLRGTYIRCVLETRIVTDYAGFTSCVVTEPVYSVNGKSLLLPKGSKLTGSYGGNVRTDRVNVIWDRVTTPTGLDVLMSSPGVDQLGGAGHPGQLDNHWASRIGSALMVSLLADAFKYAAAEHGPANTAVTDGGTVYQSPYESATARTMERMAGEVVSQAMSRSPTVTINQGTVVNVYVAKDVDFSKVLGSLR